MKFLKIANYLFHPLWIPTFGTFYFFLRSPGYYEPQVIGAKMLAVSVLTFFLPGVILYILRYLKHIRSYELKKVQERKLPLVLFTMIAAFILKYVFKYSSYPAMNLFFMAIFISGIILTLAALVQIKVSLHTTGVSGLLVFVSLLSYYFLIPGLIWMAILFLALGWTFSARLASDAHTVKELLIGILVGAIPQLLTFLLGYNM
mgnify:CR=1 FL=1